MPLIEYKYSAKEHWNRIIAHETAKEGFFAAFSGRQLKTSISRMSRVEEESITWYVYARWSCLSDEYSFLCSRCPLEFRNSPRLPLIATLTCDAAGNFSGEES